jgi:hypothetical protein
MHKKPPRSKVTPKHLNSKKRARDIIEPNRDEIFSNFANELFVQEFKQKSSQPNFKVATLQKKFKVSSRKQPRLLASSTTRSEEDVPDEVVFSIFTFIPTVTIIRSINLVCKQWRNICSRYENNIFVNHKSLHISVKQPIPPPYAIFNYFTDLKEIDLSYSGKNVDHVLPQLIARSPFLQSLNISFCKIKPDTTLPVLANCISLRRLIANGNGSNLVWSLSNTEATLLSNIEVLHIRYSKSRKLGDIMVKCNNIKELDASNTYFDDEDLLILCQNCGNSLETLKLASCFSLSADALTLLKRSCISLKKLDLSVPEASKMNRKWPIASAISMLPETLTSLSLFKNKCFENFQELQSVLISSPFISSLKELDIRETVQYQNYKLKRILHRCKSLDRLIIDTGVYDRVKPSKTIEKTITWSNIENNNDYISIFI